MSDDIRVTEEMIDRAVAACSYEDTGGWWAPETRDDWRKVLEAALLAAPPAAQSVEQRAVVTDADVEFMTTCICPTWRALPEIDRTQTLTAIRAYMCAALKASPAAQPAGELEATQRCIALQARLFKYWDVMNPLQRSCLSTISPSMPVRDFERIALDTQTAQHDSAQPMDTMVLYATRYLWLKNESLNTGAKARLKILYRLEDSEWTTVSELDELDSFINQMYSAAFFPHPPQPVTPVKAKVTDAMVEHVGRGLYIYWDDVKSKTRLKYSEKVRKVLESMPADAQGDGDKT